MAGNGPGLSKESASNKSDGTGGRGGGVEHWGGIGGIELSGGADEVRFVVVVLDDVNDVLLSVITGVAVDNDMLAELDCVRVGWLLSLAGPSPLSSCLLSRISVRHESIEYLGLLPAFAKKQREFFFFPRTCCCSRRLFISGKSRRRCSLRPMMR